MSIKSFLIIGFCVLSLTACGKEGGQGTAKVAVNYVKAGAYLCDSVPHAMAVDEVRRAGGLGFARLDGCTEAGADIVVNVLGKSSFDNRSFYYKVGNSGGTAWVTETDIVLAN